MWDVSEPFSEVDIAVIAEGTYPFARGGVSSVIHNLLEGSPNLSFGVIHLCWDGESPKESQFEKLPNLRWVKKIFLSPNWGRTGSIPPSIKLDRRSGKKLKKILADLEEGDYSSLEEFYRKHPGWFHDAATGTSPLMSHIPFLKMIVQRYFSEGLSYLDALWMSYEFTGLLTKLLVQDYPKAKIYHSHTNGYAGLAAVLAKWQNGGKFLLSEHALYVRDAISFIPRATEVHTGGEHFPLPVGTIRADRWEAWFRGLGRFVYQHIDASAYLYQGAHEEAKAYGYPELSHAPEIIPNGIELERFKPARDAQLARTPYRQEADYIWTIGFIGRVVPIKGVLEFFDSIKLLAERVAGSLDFRVLIIGPTDEDPDYFDQCLKKLRRLGLEDVVYFTGLQKIQDMLGHIDVIAIPSLSEAFPMVCLEAMASSVPIVANDVGCISQILQAAPKTQGPTSPKLLRKAGDIVAKGDNVAFADALHRMMTTPKKYQTHQLQGPMIVAENYQAANFLLQYQKLYHSLLGRPALPAPKSTPALPSYEYLKPSVLQGKS